MALDLKVTRSTYRVHDESGYAFEIVTTYDPETGWDASACVSGFGMKTEQAAIAKCLEAAQRLLAIAKETP